LLPNRGVIYGELYVPGEQAAKVSTALAQRGVIPIPEYYNLQFMPFAALWDVSMRPKLWADSTLKHVETEIRQTLDLPFAPWLTIPVGITADEFIKTPEARAILERYEGVVFKDGNLENWHKYKPVLTCDCVVLDFTDGMGKYEGMIGALVLGLYAPDGTIREVAYAGGMDDETRIGITANQDKVIGSVCEVAYQCAGSAGRLRHPRFLRFRDDKAAEDCKLTQLQTEQLQ
jgi:hypothetical protein